jgi:hypothetical protein
VEAQDAKAHTVIVQIHARRANGSPPPPAGSPVPPEPPELARLQAERDNIIKGCAATLRASLGEASYARLDRAVQAQFGSTTRRLSIRAAGHKPLARHAADPSTEGPTR